MADIFGFGKAAQAGADAAKGIAQANAAANIARAQAGAVKSVASTVATAGTSIVQGIVAANVITTLAQSVVNTVNHAIDGAVELAKMKKETECKIQVEQAMAQIDRIRKEQELDRWIKLGAAIVECQERLMTMTTNGITALANMNQDLRERAIAFVEDKRIKADQMESDALMKAADDMAVMEQKLGHNEAAMSVIVKAFDSRLSTIIVEKARFIEALDTDLKNFGTTVDTLTFKGQDFIQQHLSQVHLQAPAQAAARLEGPSPKQIQG